MKVVVIGIARSGTTALYSLLQNILTDRYGKVDFFYEPFLWDKDVFNGPYEKVSRYFSTINSVSAKGIFLHQQLPLFITNPSEYQKDAYIESLFLPEEPDRNILIKFIRANGRLQLLRRISPDARYIFIIRNPLDSVNSILSLFSYYGGEFHHDDYPRFIDGVNQQFGLKIDAASAVHPVEKEVLYWHYMNLFALRTIREMPDPPLIINYERFAADPDFVVDDICRHLGLPVREEYRIRGRIKEGVVTQSFTVSDQEFKCIYPFFDEYRRMLDFYGIDHRFSEERIVQKYRIVEGGGFREKPFYGMNPLMIADEVRKARELASRWQREKAAADHRVEELTIKLRETESFIAGSSTEP
jgi:hypothetical protein